MKRIKTTLLLCLFAYTAYAQNNPINPLADASIYQGDNTKNYGLETKLLVKNKKGSTVSRRTLLQFNLGDLKGVKKAILKIYCNNIELSGDTPATSLLLDISITDNNWIENEVSWKSAPKPLTKITSTEVSVKKAWVEIDISDYLKEIFGKSKTITLILSSTDGSGNLAEFSSKEGKNPPTLIVE
jgi:hypothetical protein